MHHTMSNTLDQVKSGRIVFGLTRLSELDRLSRLARPTEVTGKSRHLRKLLFDQKLYFLRGFAVSQ